MSTARSRSFIVHLINLMLAVSLVATLTACKKDPPVRAARPAAPEASSDVEAPPALAQAAPDATTARTDASVAAEIAADAPLRVDHIAPKGEIMGRESITIVFDQAMAELTTVAAERRVGFVEIAPAVEGTWRWVGDRALVFTPADRFAPSTAYEVTVRTAARALSGARLAEPVTTRFQTSPPKRTALFAGDDHKALDTRQVFLVFFDQRISMKGFKEHAALTAKGWPVPVRIRRPTLVETKRAGLHWPRYAEETGDWVWDASEANPEILSRILDDIADHGFAVVPDGELPRDAAVELVVSAGLKGKGGTIGMEEDLRMSFRTFGPLRFVEHKFHGWYSPASQLDLELSNPIAEGADLDDLLTLEPKVPDLEVKAYGRRMTARGRFATDTAYEARLDKRIEDRWGQALGGEGPTVVRFTTPHAQPALRFDLPRAGVIERHGRLREIPLTYINVDRASVDWWRIPVDKLARFVDGTSLWASDEDALAAKVGVVRWVNEGERQWDRWRHHPVPLKQDQGSDAGLFFMQAHAPGFNPYGQDRPFFQRALYNVTDLGLIVKEDADGALIAVSSFKDGGFVADASLALVHEDGTQMWKGKSRADAFARLPLSAYGERPGTRYLVATRADDLAVQALDYSAEVGLWSLGVHPSASARRALRGVVWGEKDLYRRGDEVHLTAVARRYADGRYRVPHGLTLRLDVSGPDGERVARHEVTLAEQGAGRFGRVDLALKTGADWALGRYYVSLSRPDAESIASGSFELGVYRKPTFTVKTELEQAHALPSDQVKAKAVALYYSGGALAHGRTTWRVTSDERAYTPPYEGGFRWRADPDPGEPAAATRRDVFDGIVVTEKAATGVDGRTRFSFRVPDSVQQTKHVTVEAEVQDLSGRPITHAERLWVHPAGVYLGLETPQLFGEVGDVVKTRYVVVSPEGEPIAGRPVTAQLYRRTWVKEVEEGLGSALDVRYKLELEPAGVEHLVSGEGGLEVEWKPAEPGSYLVRGSVKDATGRLATADTTFYVTGKGEARWYDDEQVGFELLPEQDSYRPGQTARVLVRAPFVGGTALLTIERERVIEQRLVKIDEALEVLEIPVTEDLIPNAFVSLSLTRGRLGLPKDDEADALYKPRLKLGYCKLAVDTSSRSFDVTVTPTQETWRPGERAAVDLNAPPEVNLVVAVVDEAVLDLTGYRTPDLHQRFYREFGLGVRTFSNYHRLMEQRAPKVREGAPEAKAGDVGGGGAGAAHGAPRSDFQDVAYFAPGVVTNAEGKARISFKLPDNLTRYRVMVVGVDQAERFGSGTGHFKVNKPFQIRPSAPARVGRGDRFGLDVTVQNASERAGEVQLELLVPPFLQVEARKQRVKLGPGEAGSARFMLTATTTGADAIGLEARFGADEDRVRLPVAVVVRRALEETAFFGSGSEPGRFDLRVPEGVVPDVGGVRYGVANTGLVNLEGTFREVMDYRYGCSEQLSSRLIATARALALAPVRHVLKARAEALRASADEVSRQLLQRVTWAGDVRFWERGRPYAYTTAYTFLALSEAAKAGVKVPATTLDRVANRLQNLIAQDHPGGLKDPKQIHALRAFMAYALLRAGRTAKNVEDTLVRFKDPLPDARLHLAWCVAGRAGARDVALELLQPVLDQLEVLPEHAFVQPRDGGAPARWFPSTMKTTALLASALVKINAAHPLLPRIARGMVKRLARRGSVDTHASAAALLALSDYYGALELEEPDFSIDVRLGDQVLMSDHMSGRAPDSFVDRISMQDMPKGEAAPLRFDKRGAGRMYYFARLSYAPGGDVMAVTPKVRGLSVARRLFDLDGRALAGPVEVGQAFLVEIVVAAPRALDFVVIEDPIPAGVEAVHVNFQTVSPALKQRLATAIGMRHASGADHQEIDADAVRFFVDALGPGLHRYVYLARAAHAGSYQVPGARAYEMYNPENFGSTAGLGLEIR